MREREVKTGMRELLVKRVALPDGSGGSRRYDYYITVDRRELGGFCCESYGIRVAREDGQSAAVRDITCSIPRIDALSRLVAEGGVTPATLRDVVEDWL